MVITVIHKFKSLHRLLGSFTQEISFKFTQSEQPFNSIITGVVSLFENVRTPNVVP